jgi:phosphatidylinositol-3-phosphatase
MPEPTRMTRLGFALTAWFFVNFATAQTPAKLPVPSHIVVAVEENHSYSEIVGSSKAPYINSLATQGALFTHSFAITHPSEPNYLALFSGSTQGVNDDSCPLTFSTDSLESELLAAGKTFTGYSEGLPKAGSMVCTSGKYARKHVPWTDFSKGLPADNQPFTSFPSDFTKLPAVAFVIPDLVNDMHDGTIQQGDAWLQKYLAAYVTWAQNNNSLLIIQFDEDDDSQNNQIATIFVGGMVKPGQYSEKINHYNILRTIEDMYKLPRLANAKKAKPISDVWK